MRTHKKTLVGLLVFLFICIVGIFFAWMKSMYSVKESPTLQGTFICEKLPFASMAFDLNDNYTFYYYNYDEKDKGTYSKGADNEHYINGSKFHNTKILYDGKKQTFTIMIDGEIYLFKQLDRVPIIEVEPEKKEE